MKTREGILRTWPIAILFVWIVVGSTVARGQIGGGTISGYVLDVSHAAIPGAQVHATNVATGVSASTVTNNEGFYEFPLLPPGQYVIKANHAGFGMAKSAPFALYTGTSPRVSLTLKVASSVSKVQVTAAIVPVLNTTKTGMDNVITTTEVDQLPLNGRSWATLVELVPGGENAPDNSVGSRGGMWFNGSPAYGNQILVDGIDFSAGEISAPPVDQSFGAGTSKMGGISLGAIDEISVDTGSFSAEYGGAAGAAVNIITKSGTDQYHGDAYEFVQNDVFNANSFFVNRERDKRPAQRLNQFGADLGGPIKKDKLFFFLNYEGVRYLTYTEENGDVPTPLLLSEINNPLLVQNLEQLPLPNAAYSSTALSALNTHFDTVPDTETDTSAKLDYDFGKGQHLAVRYMNNYSNYITPYIVSDDVQMAPFHYNNLSTEYTLPISSTTLDEFRFGFSRINLDRRNTGLLGEGVTATARFDGEIITTGLSGTGTESEIHYHDSPITWVDNFTQVRGAQTFMAGAQIMDRPSSRFQQTGMYTYYSSIANLIAGDVEQVQLYPGSPKALNTTTIALYAQDDWRLRRNLQLNLGLRWEHYTPLEGMFNLDSSNPFGGFISKLGDGMLAEHWRDFGPRAGVAWSVSPKTVVRVGGGISYMPTQPIFYYDFAAISPLLPELMTLTPPDVAPAGLSLTFPFEGPTLINEMVANPSILATLGINGGRNVADYDQKDYEEGQWNLSVQRALTNNLSLQVSYVANHAWHLWFPYDPNEFLPGSGGVARPLPSYGNVQYECPCADSSYEALQVQLVEHPTHGLALMAYYDYGDDDSMGNVNDTFGISGNELQNQYNIANSYGPVSGFRRQVFTLDHMYLLPTPGFASKSSYGRAILGGWSLDGVMQIHSGEPANVTAGVDLVDNTDDTGDRPDRVPGVPQYIGSTTGTLRWLNPAAFNTTTPEAEHEFGNLSYNAVTLPGSFTYDAAVHKTFNIGERVRLTFRAEAFNIFNHPVFTGMDLDAQDSTFGELTSSSLGRTLQFGLLATF